MGDKKRKKNDNTLKQQSIRLSLEDIERLEQIGQKKYRLRSRAQTIRLMIEDSWKELFSQEVA